MQLEGSCAETQGELVLLAPHNNETDAIADLLSTALACTPPGQAAAATRFRPVSDNFGDSWREGLPSECKVRPPVGTVLHILRMLPTFIASERGVCAACQHFLECYLSHLPC